MNLRPASISFWRLCTEYLTTPFRRKDSVCLRGNEKPQADLECMKRDLQLSEPFGYPVSTGGYIHFQVDKDVWFLVLPSSHFKAKASQTLEKNFRKSGRKSRQAKGVALKLLKRLSLPRLQKEVCKSQQDFLPVFLSQRHAPWLSFQG